MKKLLIGTILGLSVATSNLFASNFSYTNDLLNIDLSKDKLKTSLYGKSLNHTDNYLIDRTPASDYVNSGNLTGIATILYMGQIKKDPKEAGGYEAMNKFLQQFSTYFKYLTDVSVLETKIVGNWALLSLYASDDLPSLDEDINLVKKQIQKEIRIKRNLYNAVSKKENLTKETLAFLYDTQGFWTEPVESYDALSFEKIKRAAKKMDFDEFEEKIENKMVGFSQSRTLYPEYFNALYMTDLGNENVEEYSNIFFTYMGKPDVRNIYKNLPFMAKTIEKRFNLYLLSDYEFGDYQLKSIDYKLLKKISERWEQLSRKQKEDVMSIFADNIKYTVNYIQYQINIKTLNPSQKEKVQKFYNFDLYNNDSAIENKVINVFNSLNMKLNY